MELDGINEVNEQLRQEVEIEPDEILTVDGAAQGEPEEEPEPATQDVIDDALARARRAEAEAASIHTPQQPSEVPMTVETAFVMVMESNGHWAANPGLIGQPLVCMREATPFDLGHAADDLRRDLDAMNNANRVMALQQMMAMQVQQQQEGARIAQRLSTPTPGGPGVDLRGMRR